VTSISIEEGEGPGDGGQHCKSLFFISVASISIEEKETVESPRMEDSQEEDSIIVRVHFHFSGLHFYRGEGDSGEPEDGGHPLEEDSIIVTVKFNFSGLHCHGGYGEEPGDGGQQGGRFCHCN
jgi:hypothetical protein